MKISWTVVWSVIVALIIMGLLGAVSAGWRRE